ncbi:MAG: hypothetical protein V2A67_06360 [Bacteroidota bacterium]
MKWITRALETEVAILMGLFPAVTITGPWQSDIHICNWKNYLTS